MKILTNHYQSLPKNFAKADGTLPANAGVYAMNPAGAYRPREIEGREAP